MTAVVLQEQPFWSMVAKLRQFEGWRSLWRVPFAALLYMLPALIFIGATVVAAFIAGDDFNFRTAVVAAAVGAGATALLAPRLARRRLHRKLIADRLWTWEKPNPATEVPVLLRPDDVEAAQAALRRGKFNPQVYGLRLGVPPSDAQDLSHKVAVHEPEAWPQSTSDEDRTRRIVAVLEMLAVRGRVAGIDALPGGEGPDAPRNDGRATGASS